MGDPVRVAGIQRALDRATVQGLSWALAAGLGPLLYRAIRDRPGTVSRELYDRLLGANLAAQVRHGELIDAALDVIELCLAAGVPVTLLKGISISEQHYPEGHLRPMTDIDILLPADAFMSIETQLLRRGYRRGPDTLGPDPHHGVPLVHPKRDVWLELHTALFQRNSILASNGGFNEHMLASHSLESTFHGLPVRRLSDELQLAYVASYWTQDLSDYRIHPSFLPPMLDAIRILSVGSRRFNWDRLPELLTNDMSRASVYLLLSYLSRAGIVKVADPVLSGLALGQNLVSVAERTLIHSFIEYSLVRGRPFRLFNSWHIWVNCLEPGNHLAKVLKLPWRVLFPPGYPHRYNARRQLRRVADLARRLRG